MPERRSIGCLSPSDITALYQHLLVAIDRRFRSHRAAALALRAAWCLGARVTVLFVVASATREGTAGQTHAHEAVTMGERVFRRVRRMASIAGVPCVCRYAFGRDAQAIVRDAAKAHHCDVVLFAESAFSAPEREEPVAGAASNCSSDQWANRTGMEAS